VGREIRLIDYIENSGVALDWYARALRERPYLYAPLILPHDARARELGSGKSRAEMLEGLGFAVRIAPRIGVADGIEAVRRLLPRAWIDAARCEAGLRALRDYRERSDPKRRVALGPLHDWTSHPADAMRYLMTAYEEPQAARKARTVGRTGGGGWMG
jgi:phage terminase large subunit